MSIKEADHEPFIEYIKSKYPHADITRVGENYSNFHMQSLWDLYVYLTTPRDLDKLNQADFDRIFREP